MSNYADQNPESATNILGFEPLKDTPYNEIDPTKIFTENDRRLAYLDILSQATDEPTYSSMDRLLELIDTSYSARILLGMVSVGIVPKYTTIDGDEYLTNTQELATAAKSLSEESDANAPRSQAIALLIASTRYV